MSGPGPLKKFRQKRQIKNRAATNRKASPMLDTLGLAPPQDPIQDDLPKDQLVEKSAMKPTGRKAPPPFESLGVTSPEAAAATSAVAGQQPVTAAQAPPAVAGQQPVTAAQAPPAVAGQQPVTAAQAPPAVAGQQPATPPAGQAASSVGAGGLNAWAAQQTNAVRNPARAAATFQVPPGDAPGMTFQPCAKRTPRPQQFANNPSVLLKDWTPTDADGVPTGPQGWVYCTQAAWNARQTTISAQRQARFEALAATYNAGNLGPGVIQKYQMAQWRAARTGVDPNGSSTWRVSEKPIDASTPRNWGATLTNRESWEMLKEASWPWAEIQRLYNVQVGYNHRFPADGDVVPVENSARAYGQIVATPYAVANLSTLPTYLRQRVQAQMPASTSTP
jgi:hypothetical protein